MPNPNSKYWYACVGEPVPHHAQDTGRCQKLIVEAQDTSVREDDIREAIRTFVRFPAGTEMRWYDFKSIQIEELEKSASADGGHGISIWRVTEDPTS